MSKLDEFLTSKKAAPKSIVDPVRRLRVDSRVALYQAFAEDERAKDARTEHSPLVQWARRSPLVKPSAQPMRSKRGATLAHTD